MVKKSNAGRPPVFKSAEEMQEKIDAYFKEQDEMALRMSLGFPVYTMTGLALALGTNRQTLVNYTEKEEFFYTIQKARAKVEECVETRMVGGAGNATGLIFNAKNNFGWKDKTEVENTGDNGATVIYIDNKEKSEYEDHIDEMTN